MKKRSLKSLRLNKKVISNFEKNESKGGTIDSFVCSDKKSQCDIDHPYILICSL